MFSGIGGFEYGIQQAINNQFKIKRLQTETDSTSIDSDNVQRTTCVGYSEIDKYAIKVYERNFNGHKNYGDATTIKPEELPDFDLLVGGFPCQAFSIAGKRKGFDDTRGTLFFDIARILAEKKPKHLVLENVKGLLSHEQGRTFQTIIGILSDLGYRVEWQVLNSKDFGVPQNRERIIIIGHLRGKCERKIFPITGTDTTNFKQATSIAYDNNRNKAAEKPYSRTITATFRGHPDSDGRPAIRKDGIIRRLTPKECERLQGFPDDWTKFGINDEPISDTQRYKMCGNAVTTNVIQAVMEGLLNE